MVFRHINGFKILGQHGKELRAIFTLYNIHNYVKIAEHYETCLFKYIENFTTKKTESFPIKILIFFHISALNIDCGYSLEPPRRCVLTSTHNLGFLSRNKKNNVYPCKPQFSYIKVEFKAVWKFSDKNSDIFHISAQNIDCGYSLEPLRRGGSNEYPQSMFLSRNKSRF